MTVRTNLALEALALRVTELPPLPKALLELMRVLRDPDFSEQRCVALIESDPALAARLLRLANSAFYGVSGHVGSVGDAMRILGARTVLGVLTAAALRGCLRADACPEFPYDSYWQHTIATALAARRLASLLDIAEADEAFLAGLLHDVGQLALASFDPEAATRTFERARLSGLSTLEAEAVELGFTHPQLGALVARHWHFPEAICKAIEVHHVSGFPDGGAVLSCSDLVQLADKIAHTLNFGGDTCGPVLAPDDWFALGLTQIDLDEVKALVTTGVRNMCGAIVAAN